MKAVTIVIFSVLFAVFVAAALWVRFAPASQDQFHIKPSDVQDVGLGQNYYMLGSSTFAQKPAQVLDGQLSENAARIDQILTSELGGARFAGSLDDGWATYVFRTKWMGYPDYMSISLVSESEKTELSVFSRSRYGIRDFGVNKTRVQSLLTSLGG